MHALEVRVQTSLTPQQELSKPFSFSVPFIFWGWEFPGDKYQVQGCPARAVSGKQHEEETFPCTLTVQGRFWSLQLMLDAQEGTEQEAEHCRRTPIKCWPQTASSIQMYHPASYSLVTPWSLLQPGMGWMHLRDTRLAVIWTIVLRLDLLL